MHNRPKILLLVVLSVAMVLACPVHVARSQTGAKGRAMVPEDLLTLQAIKETAFSPDGKWAAIVVQRPRRPGESYERGYLGGLERSDVWLASTDGRRLINVTRGEAVHAGYWNPLWSADGKRLAMVSTRGGDNVRPYVYDLNTQLLRACTTNGIDLSLQIETLENKTSTMAWLGPNQLMLGVLPPGTRSLAMDESERTFRISEKAMADVKRGRGVTASVLDTEEEERSQDQLKQVSLSVVDLTTSKTRIVTRIPLIETRLSQRIVSLSPDHSYAAILATDYPNSVLPNDRQPRTEDITRLRLGVASMAKTNATPAWIPRVQPASFSLAVIPTSIRWAPSGATFAFIGTSVTDVAPAVFTVRSDSEKPEAVPALKYDAAGKTELLTVEDIQWAATGDLLVYGYAGDKATLEAEVSLKDVRGFGRDNSQETAKRDWWIISAPNSHHNLTREMAQPPRTLFKLKDSNLMAGASSGRIWAIDSRAQTVKPLSATGSIVWPRPADAHRLADHLIVNNPTTSSSDLLRLDVVAGASIKLGTLPRGTVFSDYSPRQQLIAYETEITELRITGKNRPDPITLVSLNRQLDAIAKPEYRTIQYQTVEGKQLSGALLLPFGYVSGRRYPLIVSVYGGSLPPTGDWANAYKRLRSYPDPLVLAGHGYAVLIPSIPLAPMGVQSDPMLELDKGVKPAVEKIVEMGIADPDRTGLMGFSYGGYTVYGLVTQTSRFKAAVAMAGVNDLLSVHGRIDVRYRFSDVPNPLWGPFLVEAQQMRMGVPPWKDLERYLRNSPYVHVNNVTTPLLMIHGELDSLTLSEAEQFFVALNRMGTRARLVRYLAEGHAIESPGNLLDMYQQIFNWFDEFLLNRQPNQSAKTK